MPYVPDAEELLEPTIGQKVVSAAEEFRVLKLFLQRALVAPSPESSIPKLPLLADRLGKMAVWQPDGSLGAEESFNDIIASSRILRMPVGETFPELPIASLRALTLMGFDAAGLFTLTTREGLTSLNSVENYDTLSEACVTSAATNAQTYWPGGTWAAVGNIDSFWAATHTGNGVITRSGYSFYIKPRRNQTNTIYVDYAAGDDDNDGLTPDFAFKTLQAAANAVADFAERLPGNFVFQITAGNHTHTVAWPTCMDSVNPITVKGVAAGHPNVPTTKLRPTAAGDDIFKFTRGGVFILQDLHFENATTGKALNLITNVEVTCTNVHVSGCLTGALAQHLSKLNFNGGIFTGLGKISNDGYGYVSYYNSTHGSGGSSSVNGTQFKDWHRGVAIGEGGQGHLDYFQVSNCIIGLELRRGAGACNTDDMSIDGCDIGLLTSTPWFNNNIHFGVTTPNTVNVRPLGNAPEADYLVQDNSAKTYRLLNTTVGGSHTGSAGVAVQVYESPPIRDWMISEPGNTAFYEAIHECVAGLAGTCSIQLFIFDGTTEQFLASVPAPIGAQTINVRGRVIFSNANAQRAGIEISWTHATTPGARAGAYGTGNLNLKGVAGRIRVKMNLSVGTDVVQHREQSINATFAG